MMKFLSIFGTMPDQPKGADATARAGEGDGAFASIMAFLRSDAVTVPGDEEGADLSEEAKKHLAALGLTQHLITAPEGCFCYTL